MAYSFGVPYHLVSHRGNGRCLNVYGNEQVSQNRNVCVWGWSNPETNAQKWVIRLEGAGGRIYSALSGTTYGANGYGLNAYRSGANWNCDIHTVQGNETDSLIDLLTVDAANNLYRIALVNYPGRYLTAEGTGDGSNVSWATASGGDNQVWKVTESNPAGGGGGTQPGTNFFDGHIVSHAGAGGCLNVYGDETIASHRNVCVWSWSNSNAQTWKVSAYAGQRKVFSSLQYPTYALNIYRNGTNNCDVYPHVGNDADSLIYTTAVPGKSDTYCIRLASGVGAGMALTADGSADGSNVRWTAYSGAENQQWLFTTTAPANPGIGTTIFNGHLVSYAGDGCTLNISGDEQVSNHRNVNVWYWSDPTTGAQTWRVVEYGNQKKIFSSLEYPTYALNIYRNGTNNCDMFPHSGNDADSLIYTTPVTGKSDTYIIRLASGNGVGLALTASGQYNGSNVSWAAYTGDTNQQWKFTNTKTGPTAPPSTPPPTQSDKDTALDAFFIPADTSNYTANRIAKGGSIQKITIHHCAGVMSVHTLGNLWQNPARNGSSHYGVSGVNIGQYVRERDVAWTDGNWTSNIRSVTIETSNSATGGNWPVSVSTFNTLVLLVADIAWRNGLGQLVKGVNLTWHSMYASTACPGPYLLSQMDNLVNRANALNGYSTPADPTGPVISDAAYAAGVRLGTKNGVNYYDYTAPFNNLFAMAKAQAEEHRCTSFEQYCEEWVAEYPTVQPSLAAHAGLVLGSFTWFYQQVNHDAVWDIKREERWNEALPHIPFLGVTAKQFLYNGELRSAEEMGNVMYGFVGRACGFSSITLYWGGGVAAQGGMNNPEVNTPDLYGDTQEDHDAITDGFNLFEAQYPSYPDVGFEGIPIEQGILAALADLII